MLSAAEELAAEVGTLTACESLGVRARPEITYPWHWKMDCPVELHCGGGSVAAM